MTRLTEKKNTPDHTVKAPSMDIHQRYKNTKEKVVTKNKYSRSVQAAAIVISSQGSRRIYFLTEKIPLLPPEAVALLLDR